MCSHTSDIRFRRRIADIFCKDCPKPRKIGENPGKRQSSQKKWPFFVRGWQRTLSCVTKRLYFGTAHTIELSEPAPNSQAHIASDREGADKTKKQFISELPFWCSPRETVPLCKSSTYTIRHLSVV